MITAQLPLGVQLRDRPDFDSYYAGPNRDVVGALYEIASGHSSGLYLYGSRGQGKSHLLQACGHAADRASRSSVYLPLAELASAGPEALAGHESRQLICLDDIDAVVAQRDWAVALLRLLDRRRTDQLPILVAANCALERLPCAFEDLRSRLAVLAVYGLRPLDDLNRANLLAERMRGRGLKMPEEVARFLLARLPRDTGTLIDAVDQLDAASLSAKRRLTIPFVQSVLHALLPPPTSRTADH